MQNEQSKKTASAHNTEAAILIRIMRVLGVRRKFLSVSLIIVALACIALAALQLVLNVTKADLQPVQFKTGTAYVRIADDEGERAKGLSGVKDLPYDQGLLMNFQSDETWAIWMKDMEIPLDIIWLNKDKEVIYIVRNVQPEVGTSKTFKPLSPARYVIELNAGVASRYMIAVGDVVKF